MLVYIWDTICNTNSIEKRSSIYQVFTVLKTRPYVTFINIFTHSFYARRSQQLKKDRHLDIYSIFALLGSLQIKALRKMLVKLTSLCLSLISLLQPLRRKNATRHCKYEIVDGLLVCLPEDLWEQNEKKVSNRWMLFEVE